MDKIKNSVPITEQKQLPMEGLSFFSKEVVLDYYLKNRIDADPVFKTLYSTYQKDMERVEKFLVRNYSESQDKDGKLAEAYVLACISKGAIAGVTARGATLYDDYFKKADIILESTNRQFRDPVVSTIDVTTHQKNSAASLTGESGREGISGFDKKIARIRKHVDFLASISDEQAVGVSAWMQGGGLLEEKTEANQSLFDLAERLMLIKYYTNPKGSENEGKPQFIVSGPQIVISIESTFINRISSTKGEQQQKAVTGFSALLQVEVLFSIAMLTQYVEQLAASKKADGQGTNLFFASYRAACRAWEGMFSSEINQMRLGKAMQICSNDPIMRAQLKFFQKTLREQLAPVEKSAE